MQRGRARAIADDPDFEAGDATAQHRGGAEEDVDALAAVKTADEENREPI